MGVVASCVRVLGPCVVDVDGGPSRVLSSIQRRILARLAAAGRSPVTVAVLAEAVWGDDQPRTAKAAVINQVSRIRASVGSGVVVTTTDGYVLGVETDIDLVAEAVVGGERAVLDGHHAGADRLLTEALDQWRGRSFAEIEHVAEIEAERRRVAELRVAAENLRLMAALRSGRAGFAVPEAERLVGHSPFDEQRWVLLAQALDLAGRRGDALAAFQRARRSLRDGLGLDPGPVLRAAEAAMLSIDAVRGGAAARVVGRDRELGELVALAERGECVVVRGEAGAGASTVLAALARRLHGRLAVAFTGCADASVTPVGVLVDLLEQFGETERGVEGVIEQFVTTVRRLAAHGRVVLVVDDVHLAGPSTVAALLAAAAEPGVGLVVSARETMRALDVGWVSVVLGPLDAVSIAERLADLTGSPVDPDAARVRWLTAMSGGNPLFLESLLEDPAVHDLQPDPRAGAPVSEPLATSLVGHVRARLDRLGSTTRSAVEVAAVAGLELPVVVLDQLASPAGVAAAFAAGLLVQLPGHRARFHHGVVQRVVYFDLPPGRRMELHHAIGRLLDSDGHRATIVARHLLEAGEMDPAPAVAAGRRAAREAMSLGAHRDAASWFERAAEVARLLGPGGERELVTCLIGRGDALRLAGDADHERVLFDAAERAVTAGDPALVADAAFAVMQLGFTTGSGQVHERARQLAEHALSLVTEPDARARVAAAASLGHSMTGEADRCRALFLEAYTESVSSEVRCQILPFAYLALGTPEDLELRSAITDELSGLAAAAGDSVAAFEARHLGFSVALQRADGDGARDHLAEMVAMVDDVGDVGRRWAVLYQTAAVAHLDDDLDRSEAVSEEAMALLAPVAPSRAIAVYGGQLLAIRLAQGRLGELRDVFGAMVVDQPEVPAWHAALSLSLVGIDDAAALGHAVTALDDVPHDFLWLAAHVIGGRTAARVGDETTARRYLGRLEPWAGRVCWQGTCSYGPVDLVLAALHDRLGDTMACRHHAGRALEQTRRLRAPVYERELAAHGFAPP